LSRIFILLDAFDESNHGNTGSPFMLKCNCMLVIRCIEHSCVHQRRIS
jgi:hypothetical protein